MAAIKTIQIPLGFSAPDFSLFDPISGTKKSLNELKSDKGTVIMFICNHCPYVKHIMDGLIQIANDYIPKGISFIGINSNDIKNFPEDHPDKMKELVKKKNIPFHYLFDEDQSIAKAYCAACTPDFNIFDGEMNCVYRGQFDDSRPGNEIAISGNDMRKALDLLLSGNKIPEDQIASIGCSIKWKS